MTAVSDAGPLIHLSWLDLLDLLPRLFDQVLAPKTVHDEVLHGGGEYPGMPTLRAAWTSDWLKMREVAVVARVVDLLTTLDRGEAEALVLMTEARGDILLLDDGRARARAISERLPIMGTIGILRLARDNGYIPTVLPLLVTLREFGFRISDKLVQRIREEESTA